MSEVLTVEEGCCRVFQSKISCGAYEVSMQFECCAIRVRFMSIRHCQKEQLEFMVWILIGMDP